MNEWYFAYGSNMNPGRMEARGMQVLDACPGRLPGYRLVFDKRAADRDGISYANIRWSPGAVVEGVLYRLVDHGEIARMDAFEGTPRLYSREIFNIVSAGRPQPAWVYVANRAMLTEGLRPADWYLEHLLQGRSFLSEAYYQWLSAVETTAS